jgi:RNA polymerase sigma-70 factor (ECF subfamily)
MPATDSDIRALYERYAPVLHWRARGLLGRGEAAADAVQETFARVIRHWDDFRGAASPLTWMVRIETNWCLNRIRDRRGHQRKHDERRADIVGDTHHDPVDGVDDARVRALLDLADEETRAIVVHLFFDDCTREETAALVGLSVPTVRKRLDAFLRRARRALGDDPVLAGLAASIVLFLLIYGVRP